MLWMWIVLASAQAERPALPFPARSVAGEPHSVVLAIAWDQVASLGVHERILLQGIPWDTGLDLELERQPSPLTPRALHVNGQQVFPSWPQGSCWNGTVRGEDGSEAFVAFAGGAVWGWIQRAQERIHVTSRPDAAGDWERGETLLLREDEGLAASFAGRCAIESPRAFRRLPGARRPTSLAATASTMPSVLRCRLAVETDWQFYQLFGNLAVAEGYVRALLAAANTRFRAQVGVVHSVSYLGFYTTPADPWLTQDIPGSDCFDTLYEFQAAWSGGGAPVQADLHHLLSGVNLGCGVAFLDALCDPDESFSLTSKLNGETPFPVATNVLNWDFVWMCHELGHNYGSPHTHEYCPPLDECSPPGYWGPCQDEKLCTTTGTMMSYCHACPGGMANFTTWFHPVVAQTMRLVAEASCFLPFTKALR